MMTKYTFSLKNNPTTFYAPNYKSTDYSKILDDLINDDIIEKNFWLGNTTKKDTDTIKIKINDKYSNDNIIDAVDPTAINHLWPAHKLTYAIVISSGTLQSFSLSSWDEVTSPSVLTQVGGQDVEISLSWAINMYGGAYYVSSTATVTDDIATGFTTYNSDIDNNTLVDKFTYSQSNIAPAQKTSINILNSISGTSGNDKRVILYFSIEYSDDSSTYYTYNNPYYVKDTLGNSNCYEKLSLTDLEFLLV